MLFYYYLHADGKGQPLHTSADLLPEAAVRRDVQPPLLVQQHPDVLARLRGTLLERFPLHGTTISRPDQPTAHGQLRRVLCDARTSSQKTSDECLGWVQISSPLHPGQVYKKKHLMSIFGWVQVSSPFRTQNKFTKKTSDEYFGWVHIFSPLHPPTALRPLEQHRRRRRRLGEPDGLHRLCAALRRPGRPEPVQPVARTAARLGRAPRSPDRTF